MPTGGAHTHAGRVETHLDAIRRRDLWILICFLISRALYYASGIRFQTNRLATNFQFLDLTLLRDRLWETLYYCHGQPPLMNAIIGLCLKVSPTHYGGWLHAFYMLLGAGSALLLYRVMVYLGVSDRLAFLFTLLFIASPGCVLFENYPLYEYEMMFLLLLSCVLLQKLVERPSTRLSFYFFTAWAALAWIRSIYHLYVLILVAAVLVAYLWKARFQVLTGAAVPILSVLILYLKNWMVFGLFGASSWLGANLIVVSAHQISPAEKLEMVRQGHASELVLLDPGESPPAYRRFIPDVPKTGIPILDEDMKQTGGGPNTNNLVYLKIDPQYRQVAKQVLREHPKAFLKSFSIALFCYFLPPTDYFHFEESRAAIRPLDRVLNVFVYGQFAETTRKGLRELQASGQGAKLVLYTGTFLIVMVPLLLGWGVYLAWKTRPRNALMLYLLFHIVFVLTVTTLLSSFENNRYRFPTDPMYVALFATMVQAIITTRSSRMAMAK